MKQISRRSAISSLGLAASLAYAQEKATAFALSATGITTATTFAPHWVKRLGRT